MEKYLSRQEAASYLRVKPEQIDKWVRQSQLKRLKVSSKKTLFAIEELDRFVTERAAANEACK